MTTRLEPVWRIVPVEPIEAMMRKAIALTPANVSPEAIKACWSAMLAAAPAHEGMRQQVETILREQVYLQHIGDDVRVVGYGQATDAIFAIFAIIAKGEG
jgi:hypothetical protein